MRHLRQIAGHRLRRAAALVWAAVVLGLGSLVDASRAAPYPSRRSGLSVWTSILRWPGRAIPGASSG